MDAAEQTRAWVENFVIHHGLCPFAALPFRRGQVAFQIQKSDDVETCFNWALTQVQELLGKEPGEVATSLLIFPHALANFNDFLDFVATFEDVLAEVGADELLQLAHFHPAYQFAGTDPADPANRTNRSPFPVVQLLRVADVAAAVAAYPDVEDIPERNVELMRRVFPG